MFELSGVYSYVSSVEGSGGMPNLFELARVRVIACSSYRDSTVISSSTSNLNEIICQPSGKRLHTSAV